MRHRYLNNIAKIKEIKFIETRIEKGQRWKKRRQKEEADNKKDNRKKNIKRSSS